MFKIFIFSLLLFFGCAFKTDHAPSEIKNTSKSLDLDGDGLPNNSDPSPLEANFPRVSIQSLIEGKITFYQSYNNGKVLKKDFSLESLKPEDVANSRIKFLSLYFSKMKNQRKENPLLDGSLINIYTLKSLSTENQFKLEEYIEEINTSKLDEENLQIYFDLNFTLNFMKVMGVFSIGRIKITPTLISPTLEELSLGDFLLLEGINRPLEVNIPADTDDFKYNKTVNLKFFSNEKSIQILEKLAKGYTLAIKIKDYSFNSFGANVNLSDLLLQIENQTTLLLEFSPVNFKYNYFVPQNAYPVGVIDLTDTGFINSYLGLGNTLDKDPIVDALSIYDFQKGSWFVLGDTDNIKAVPNPGEKIALAYLTGEDLTKSTFTEKRLLENTEIATEFSRSDLIPGESYQFIITGTSSTPQISPPNAQKVECGANRRFCTTDYPEKFIHSCEEYFRWGERCEVYTTAATEPKVEDLIFTQDNFPKIYFDNELEKVEFFPSNDGKKLRFKIDIPTEKTARNLKIVFPDKKSMPILIYGFVGYGNCAIRNKSGFRFKNFSTDPHSISGDIHFQYHATVTKWGKNY